MLDLLMTFSHFSFSSFCGLRSSAGWPTASTKSTSCSSGRPRISWMTLLAGVPSAWRLSRICIQQEPSPRSSICSCMMMAAMEPSSIQQGLVFGSPMTTMASGASLRNVAPLSLASDRAAMAAGSSVTAKCQARTHLAVGDMRAARRIRRTSSALTFSSVYLRWLRRTCTNVLKSFMDVSFNVSSQSYKKRETNATLSPQFLLILPL